MSGRLKYWMVIVLVVILTGCTSSAGQQTTPSPVTPSLMSTETMPPTETPDPRAQYLALGDSYTIGENVEIDERWSMQLVELLRAEGIAIADPVMMAQTGWATTDLLRALDALGIDDTYDLVTLQIGVNNQYQGGSIDEFRQEYRELLALTISYTGGEPERVIAFSIPDYSVTPFAATRGRLQIAEELEAFNNALQEEAEAGGVRYVNVTPLSQEAGDNTDLLTWDRLHPSGLMYERWADLALPEARAALGQ